MVQQEFQDFLDFTRSQEAVSLVLAKDESEQTQFLSVLIDQGFREMKNVEMFLSAVTSPSKLFYVMQPDLPKEMNEFISQYPTRHIGIFNTSTGKNMIATPLYENVSIVCIITKENLQKIQQQGYTLFDKVGLTFQS